MNMLHRRAFFKSASTAALAATATPALAFQVPITETPDPLPEWFRKWQTLQVRWFDEGHDEDGEQNALGAILEDERDEIEQRIMNARATSIQGAVAQLDLAIHPDSFIGRVIGEDPRDRVVFENIRAALVGGLV